MRFNLCAWVVNGIMFASGVYFLLSGTMPLLFWCTTYGGIRLLFWVAIWGVVMTSHYKGVRITELLEDIARLQEVLEATKGSVDSAEEAMQVVAGEATLAIMKAKLTALQRG
jgi:hypothetical protein